jgi:hypothetical protein
VSTGALATGVIITGILGSGKAKELRALASANPRVDDGFGSQLGHRVQRSSLQLVSDVCSGAAVVVGRRSLWLTLRADDKSTEARQRSATPSWGQPFFVEYEQSQIQLRGSF